MVDGHLFSGQQSFSGGISFTCCAHKHCACRKHEGRAFQVLGCDTDELERWGLSQTGHDLTLEGEAWPYEVLSPLSAPRSLQLAGWKL